MRLPREWAQMTREEAQVLRSGGQGQVCFKKEQMVHHVSAAGRSRTEKRGQ